jgi:hypothetical protein
MWKAGSATFRSSNLELIAKGLNVHFVQSIEAILAVLKLIQRILTRTRLGSAAVPLPVSIGTTLTRPMRGAKYHFS